MWVTGGIRVAKWSYIGIIKSGNPIKFTGKQHGLSRAFEQSNCKEPVSLGKTDELLHLLSGIDEPNDSI